MSKERLSKLQKWILTTAYNKTILFDNSGLILLNEWEYNNRNYCEAAITYKINRLKDKEDLYWQYLFRGEILETYFKRKSRPVVGLNQRLVFFEGKGNKEQVILTNSLKNLYNKGLINIWNGQCTRWQGIKLTDKGISLIINTQIISSSINNKE